MDAVRFLPPAADLSPTILSFLNSKLSVKDDLDRAPDVGAELEQQCASLDRSLRDLNRKLESSLIAYASHSVELGGVFQGISHKLNGLQSAARISGLSSDGRNGEGEKLETADKILREELPALAKEVARVETVRAYAETTLKLDTMVGDVEDAVSSVMEKNLRKHTSGQKSEETRQRAIDSIKLVEDSLSSVAKKRPQWTHLVSAVDHRVDRALAILRPQAIADHRKFLASLGWPPPFSTMESPNSDTRNATVDLNPLFTMQGDLKQQYCESFLDLCNLQELQKRRKSRQLEACKQKVVQNQPLWAIEELVHPMSIVFQRHFSKWTDKPEFIFALVYKVTRDYVDSMDELLQPLVDRAMLTGYSCREEWISAMVSFLSTYLAKEIIPMYITQLEEGGAGANNYHAKMQWLNLVDLMMSFDKRIQSLVVQSEVLLQEVGSLERTSSLSVFSDRPDWLDLWADIELSDVLDKLKLEVANEKNWKLKVDEDFVSSFSNYKSPAICGTFVRLLSSVVDHCRSLPKVSMRSQFIRLAGVPLVQNFLDCMLQRCQEAEGLTALTDDNAVMKVANSINAAHYLESVLREWEMDFFFLEMGAGQEDLPGLYGNHITTEEPVKGSGDGIFDKELKRLEKFRIEWVEKVSLVILRGFNAQCRDYMKNRKQWQEKLEEGWTVSPSFVIALDYLQGKMSLMEQNLNDVDFVGFWRSLAAGIDHLVFNGVITNSVKFHDAGTERLRGDLQMLFGVFSAWCLRPEVFFPKSSEGLKMLKMGQKDLQQFIATGEKAWLRDHGIYGLGMAEAEKIAKSRVHTS
uniref:Uncharacterized protein n=1 Tax=Kalanchoe fedtschenkoi TaxID=63787 RepID=A0A7N0VF60_KALFE